MSKSNPNWMFWMTLSCCVIGWFCFVCGQTAESQWVSLILLVAARALPAVLPVAPSSLL